MCFLEWNVRWFLESFESVKQVVNKEVEFFLRKSMVNSKQNIIFAYV